MHLRRLLTVILCAALCCLCFVFYLNSVTIPRDLDLNFGRLRAIEQTIVFESKGPNAVVQGLFRRKENAAALAVEVRPWSAERRLEAHGPELRVAGLGPRRDARAQPAGPAGHLLPAAHFTAAPAPSDRSSSPSSANSPVDIHRHATTSLSKTQSAVRAAKVKLHAKSQQLGPQREQGQRSIWPSPRDPWDDRIVEQLSYLPQRASQNTRKDKLRTIFMYSSLGNTPPGREKFLQDQCVVDTCTLTTDTSWLGEADAVVFPYDPGAEVRLWPRRPAHQIWILSFLESPLNLPSISGLSDQINWTATYRLDSTIVTPYAKLVPSSDELQSKELPKDLTSRLRGKTKQVAWFVSNCMSNNRRMEYARELSNYIRVDIYGDCGTLKCSRADPLFCQIQLKLHYKFYLAFENSNCQYYITEKFFNALR